MFEACRKLGPAFASLAIAASVAACAAPSGVTDLGAFECKQISQRAEAKINWARVPEREIVIRNDAFSPMVMRLMQGRPYVIRVRNRLLNKGQTNNRHRVHAALERASTLAHSAGFDEGTHAVVQRVVGRSRSRTGRT